MDMDKLEKEAEEAILTIAIYCDSICDCNNCIFTGKGKVSNCVLRINKNWREIYDKRNKSEIK